MYSNYCLFFVSIVSTKLTIDVNDNTTNWVMKMNQKKMFENRIEQIKSVVLKRNSKYDNVKKNDLCATLLHFFTCTYLRCMTSFATVLSFLNQYKRTACTKIFPATHSSFINWKVCQKRNRSYRSYRRSSEGQCWLRCYNQGR